MVAVSDLMFRASKPVGKRRDLLRSYQVRASVTPKGRVRLSGTPHRVGNLQCNFDLKPDV
jgi:hypothetical protein